MAGDGVPQPDSINSFQNQTEHDRAPADKYSRRVEIGNGRTSLKHHPINQTEGMDHKRQRNQAESRAAQRFQLDLAQRPRLAW